MPATLWVQGLSAVPKAPSAIRFWSVAPSPALPTMEHPHSPEFTDELNVLHVMFETVRFLIAPPFT